MNNEMIFLMGQPGAGKTTCATEMFGATHVFICCDLIMSRHPDYDPKDPGALYAWSSKESERVFDAAMEVGQGNWIVDGTGANAERMVQGIQRARQAGFTIKLMYVRCSLETSLRRNARRARTVSAECVIEKHGLVATSFELVSPYVDEVLEIDNDAERQITTETV